jgi:hypothetical protein
MVHPYHHPLSSAKKWGGTDLCESLNAHHQKRKSAIAKASGDHR